MDRKTKKAPVKGDGTRRGEGQKVPARRLGRGRKQEQRGLAHHCRACHGAPSMNSSRGQLCGGTKALPGPGEPAACRVCYGNRV